MSAARRFALILTLALATVALGAASVHAQATPTNPSGGTSLRQTIEEGTGSGGLADFLSRGLSFDLGLRSWISSIAVSRSLGSAAARPIAGRTLSAVLTRPVWRR